jgi:hypothetical protein
MKRPRILTRHPNANKSREVTLAYLLTRLENMSSTGDPSRDLLPGIYKELDLADGLTLRSAQERLREVLPAQLSHAVECLLTGQPWPDDGGKLVGERSGGGSL